MATPLAKPITLTRPYQLIDRRDADASSDRAALISGLMAPRATVSPKYLYDRLGCALFAAICELPEYYPTLTERILFNQHRREIAAAIGGRKQLVDLGAGDCEKGEAWLSTLLPTRYIAVDIAADQLSASLQRISAAFPEIESIAVATDFSHSLDLHDALAPGPVTFFYPGSSIGNFTTMEALRLLTQIRGYCGRGGGLLVGVDTKKSVDRLLAAYDDELGVTAAFNRNLLNHVNRILGSDFEPSQYDHVALYDESRGRIEMHLQARQAMLVQIGSHRRQFAARERIHTESSYKYAPHEFEGLLRQAGFHKVQCWLDSAGDFAVFYAC